MMASSSGDYQGREGQSLSEVPPPHLSTFFLSPHFCYFQPGALFTLCFQADHRIHVLISLVSIDMFSIHKSGSETTNGFSLWELIDLTTRVLFPLSLAWLSSPVPCFP